MSKTLLTMAFAAILSLTACSGGDTVDTSTATNADITSDATDIDLDLPNGTPGLAKRIVSENLYIDIDSADFEEVSNAINVCSRRQVLGEDIPAVEITDRINDNIAKIKAAIYRLYSNLSIVDNKMVLAPGCTAESMKISDALFKRMQADIDQSNEFIRLQTEAGNATEIAPITDEYLNSLLE